MTLSFWRSQQSTRYNFARVTRRGFFGPLQIAFEEQGLFWKYITDNTVYSFNTIALKKHLVVLLACKKVCLLAFEKKPS